ncbi:MAG: flavodoxin family protein [bacterium]|nr:flavodoxin family protein [bacterium]
MKKILGIVGSPRKNGNTDILVSKIIEGAKSQAAKTDTVYLADLDIRECDGCHVCWKGNPCSKQDDMNAIYSKIIDSDIIIFGTPVYWYGPTALMKMFIDRFVYFNCPENRKKIVRKQAIIAVPFEEDNPATASLVETFFEKCFDYLQIELIAKLIVGGVTRKGEILKEKDRIAEAYELGKKISE